jgi:hypothetical protein
MVGRNPRDEIDIIIIKILERKDSSSIGYTEMEKKVNLRVEGNKPSSATLSRHLTDLCKRKVLHREVDKNRGTHYSLKKDFKVSLGKQKGQYPLDYVEKTLSLDQFSGTLYLSEVESRDEKAIEFSDTSYEDEDS